MLLIKYHEQAIKAFQGTSFFPIERGTQTIEEFSAELSGDLEKLEPGNKYQAKYEDFFTTWLNSKSRCLSFMITGAARFPVEKNKKNIERSMNAWDKWRKWRENYFKAVNRQRTLSPEEELDNALAELDRQLEKHELMRGINKIMYSKKLSEKEKQEQAFAEYGIEAAMPYVSFELSGSNQRIKRLRDKVIVMRNRIYRKSAWESIEFEGGVIDIQADRVVVKHDEKPSREIIDRLKSRGFRWSRKHASWCRKHTAQAIIDAKNILQDK